MERGKDLTLQKRGREEKEKKNLLGKEENKGRDCESAAAAAFLDPRP